MNIQILNPETGKMINLYSNEVNQLLTKYKESEIQSQSRLDIEKWNRNTISNDIIYNIMLNATCETISNLSMIDKSSSLLANAYFWKNKINKDYFILEEMHFTVKEYIKLQAAYRSVETIINTKKFIYEFNNFEELTRILSKNKKSQLMQYNQSRSVLLIIDIDRISTVKIILNFNIQLKYYAGYSKLKLLLIKHFYFKV